MRKITVLKFHKIPRICDKSLLVGREKWWYNDLVGVLLAPCRVRAVLNDSETQLSVIRRKLEPSGRERKEKNMNTVIVITSILALVLAGVNILFILSFIVTKRRPPNLQSLVGSAIYILLAGRVLGWWWDGITFRLFDHANGIPW